MRVQLEGRSFMWRDKSRVIYVRRSFPLRWIAAPREIATHVIHAGDVPREFSIRKVGNLR